MPQLNGGGGDDLGANDELISFKDEGEQEEKNSENSSAERDLADVKSSLVNESETNQNSSSDSEAERRPPPRSESFRDKSRESLEEAAKRQDGGLFKGPPYPGYPFIMIPDLTSPYLPNGSLSPTARTLHFQSGSTHYSAYKTIEHQIAIQVGGQEILKLELPTCRSLVSFYSMPTHPDDVDDGGDDVNDDGDDDDVDGDGDDGGIDNEDDGAVIIEMWWRRLVV